MANMDAAVVALLIISSLLQVATTNHCPFELTKPNQVIDVDQSKGLKQFDDIGTLHVDGKTEEARMKECVDICCHAGAGCNVVSLDQSIQGRDGDNCHLFKCDPPEDCKWKVQDGFQSALLTSMTTTAPSVETTSVTDSESTSTAYINRTTLASNVTTIGSNDTTTVSSDTTTDSTVTSTAKAKRGKEDVATTEATVTDEGSGEIEGTTAESLFSENTTTDGLQSTTEAAVTKAPKKGKGKGKVKVPDNSTEVTTVAQEGNVTDKGGNSTDTTTQSTTEVPLDDTTTEFSSTTASSQSTTTAVLLETTPKNKGATNSTATPKSNRETTLLIQSTNTSLAPTTSFALTGFDNNDTQTPAPLRAKTADMSSNTVTALACALAAGAMFVGIIATIIGKRFYDNWHRRHYQQIDYLVDGMYEQ